MAEKGFSGFRKTAPILFYPKPRDAAPLFFIPRTPQVVFGPQYFDGGGGGPREARFGGGVPGTSWPVAPQRPMKNTGNGGMVN